MTLSGIASALATSELRIAAIESGSSEGESTSWPTPRAIDGRGAQSGTSDETLIRRAQTRSGDSRNLPEMVQSRERDLWPTPLGTDAKGGRRSSHGRPDGLQSAISERTWPTPKASPSGPDFARAGRDGSGGDDLATAVVDRPSDHPKLWPTPRASEWKGVGPLGSKSQDYRLAKGYLDATVQDAEQRTGALNPDWVEWLMGFPIGWTNLEIGDPDLVDVDWSSDPADAGEVARVASGVPRRRERLTALGNGVVPEIPERLGRYLLTLLED